VANPTDAGGITFERVQSNVNAPGWLGGQYVFNSMSDFLHASPFYTPRWVNAAQR